MEALVAVETLDDSNFNAALSAPGLAVVDFYAGWCGPCRMFAPKFKRLSDAYAGVRFYKLDGEKAPTARQSVKIDNLPFFAVYRDGVFVEGLSTSEEAGFRALLDRHVGSGS